MTVDRPLVSVVMPVHQGEAHLEEAIRSVLAQTYRPLELVVVDDGSTDGSLAIARRHESDEVRVISTPNGGVGRARNVGLAAAQGDVVAFLDQDDVFPPDSVERRVDALLEAPGRFVYGDLAWLGPSPDGRPTSLGAEHRVATTYAQAWARIGITTPGQVVVRRADALAAGGFPDDRAHGGSDDRGFWLRLVERGVLPHAIGDVVLRYRVHAGQASRTVRFKRARLALREATVFAGDPPRRMVPDDEAAPVLAVLGLDLAHDLLDHDAAEAERVAQAARSRWPALESDARWDAYVAKRGRKAIARLPFVGPLARAIGRLARPSPARWLALGWVVLVLALYALARLHVFAPWKPA